MPSPSRPVFESALVARLTWGRTYLVNTIFVSDIQSQTSVPIDLSDSNLSSSRCSSAPFKSPCSSVSDSDITESWWGLLQHHCQEYKHHLHENEPTTPIFFQPRRKRSTEGKQLAALSFLTVAHHHQQQQNQFHHHHYQKQ